MPSAVRDAADAMDRALSGSPQLAIYVADVAVTVAVKAGLMVTVDR